MLRAWSLLWNVTALWRMPADDRSHLSLIIGTAGIVCRAGFVQLLSMHASVCLSHPAATRHRCSMFAAVSSSARRYWSIDARPAVSSSRAKKQVRAVPRVSWCRKLNTDFFPTLCICEGVSVCEHISRTSLCLSVCLSVCEDISRMPAVCSGTSLVSHEVY